MYFLLEDEMGPCKMALDGKRIDVRIISLIMPDHNIMELILLAGYPLRVNHQFV